MSNKELLRKAFDDVCIAMVELESVKTRLAELHYRAELVEDTKTVLDSVSERVEPSDDAHEAVFHQHQKALDGFRDAMSNHTKDAIAIRLGMAYSATSEAYSYIQKV